MPKDFEVPEGIENRRIYEAAIDILAGRSEDNPLRVSELMSGIVGKIENPPKEYLVYQSLLDASKIPGSLIRSRKGKAGGYFLASALDVESEDAPSKAEQKKEKTLERHLWPVVANWLRSVRKIDNVSSEIANMKGGGIWSNPDIVGLNIFEELGFFDVEITTLEVKPSLSQWRYYFFESVSHKRFSERVYFVYRDSGQSDADERLELFRYAEKYGIGIVEMQFDEGTYERLRQWDKLSDADRAEITESFVELVPAPFEAISIKDKISFLKQVGIKTKADIYNFGRLR